MLTIDRLKQMAEDQNWSQRSRLVATLGEERYVAILESKEFDANEADVIRTFHLDYLSNDVSKDECKEVKACEQTRPWIDHTPSEGATCPKEAFEFDYLEVTLAGGRTIIQSTASLCWGNDLNEVAQIVKWRPAK
jgi:predicted DNA-binding ribbon-helix-helix protein